MPQILDGNRVRDEIMSELKPRVAALAARVRPPGLAVVLADTTRVPRSTFATRSGPARSWASVGDAHAPDSVTTEELLGTVAELNARPRSMAFWCSFRCRRRWRPSG